MPTMDGQLIEADRRNMRAVMDRLIPPVDHLPGAGAMGLLEHVEDMTARHEPFRKSLAQFLDVLATDMSVTSEGGFPELAPEQQDNAIRQIEQSLPAVFHNVLEMVYLAYYGHPEVHTRIGWRTGPLQPRGFTVPPFDESILATIRRRQPFWRKVTN